MRRLSSRAFTAIILFIVISCAPRNRTSIPDYIVLPNGKEVLGTKPLHAFIFENYSREITFQDFLMRKYGLSSMRENEIWVTVSGQRFRLLVYDNSELEKYYTVSDFIVTDSNPNPIDPNSPKFIAISILSDSNDDCLSEKSLFYRIATNYLKEVKDEYNKR